MRLTEPLDAGQIRVEMALAPINPSDLIPVQGRYSHRISLPFVPGYDGVGTVIEVSRGVDAALIGRRVLPLRGGGTWQQTVCSPAEFAVAIPDWMDDDCAAQLYINPLTAWVVCRHQFAIQPGQTVVVNAANSVLGRLFAQLSSVIGFRMIAVVRNTTHRHLLLNSGAEAVIEDMEHAVEAVKQFTGGVGADYAIDLVGSDSGTRLAFALRPQGRFMALGATFRPSGGLAADLSAFTDTFVKCFISACGRAVQILRYGSLNFSNSSHCLNNKN
jgi:NADPH:quinone reductase-like Zn-dependent oxidoreductase